MTISKRCPTHPGKILKEHYLEPLDLDIHSASNILGILKSKLNNILQEQEEVSPEIALRLSQAFDTTPDLWIGLQKNYDLWIAARKYEKEIKKIPKLYKAKILNPKNHSKKY